MYNAINLFTRGFLELYLIKLLLETHGEKGKGKGGGGMRFPYRHACDDMPSAYDAIRPTLFWTYICAYKPLRQRTTFVNDNCKQAVNLSTRTYSDSNHAQDQGEDSGTPCKEGRRAGKQPIYRSLACAFGLFCCKGILLTLVSTLLTRLCVHA